MGATLTTLDAVLKETYGPKIVNQMENDVVFLNIMKKKTRPFVGKRFVVPVKVTRNEGQGFRAENATLPSAGNQGYEDIQVTPTYYYGKFSVTGQAIEQGRNDVGAFARSQTKEAQGLVEDMSKRLNQALYLPQTGARGTVTSVSSNTFTLTKASKGLEVGMIVDVFSSDYATKRNSTDLEITAVTESSLNDTSVTAITVSGTHSGVTSTDIIVQKGSITAAGGSAISVIGLEDAIKASGTYLTINPSTYPIWKASVLDNSGTNRSISEDLIQQLIDRVRQKSRKSITDLLTTFNQRRRFFNSLSPNRRYVNTKKLLGGGAEVVEFDGRQLIVDPDAPPYTLWGLNRDVWGVAQTRDGHWIDDDGTVLHRDLDDKDAYFATWRWFFQLWTEQRNASGKLTDLTE